MPKKLTTDEFIEKAKEVHEDKYDYSKVNYVNSKTKVCIICKEHGEFWQKPNNHLNGQECYKCGKISCSLTKTRTQEEFIQQARLIHKDKYDYSKVEYKGCDESVCIICPEHGEFWQKPSGHLQKRGCKKCATDLNAKRKLKTNSTFLDELYKVHGSKYDYSKVMYVNANTKVCIICKEHGEFWQKPTDAIYNKCGCPICGKIRNQKSLSLTVDEFIKRSNEIHNFKYNYSKVNYINNRTKVCIICPIHGEFDQIPDKHLKGCGCPKCSHSVSHNEIEISNYIKTILNIKVKERIKTLIKPYEIDMFVLDNKLAIEYNGLLWHSEKYGKDKSYHLNKLNECNKQSINLIQIFEDEYLEHKDIVLSKIKHILGKDTDLPKIQARKCVVKEITKEDSREFLNKNHIQGACNASIHLGCFQDAHLVGVMTFKEERKGNNRWELNRFATDISKRCIGIGGKLFNYFVKTYKPDYIKSFADRRWTMDKNNNLYTKLGFKLGEVLKPDYRYFFNKRYGATRVHKFNFRKQTLIKKYPNEGLTEDMTEYEMTQKLGAYRIWDCGLFKFEWQKK